MLAVRTRLELATPCVTGMYSNQLNYRTKKKCERFIQELNALPHLGLQIYCEFSFAKTFFCFKLKFFDALPACAAEPLGNLVEYQRLLGRCRSANSGR